MTQITTSERIAVFHAYRNAKVQYKGEQWQVNYVNRESDRIGVSIPFASGKDWVKPERRMVIDISDCSLLLRNISALTDAEAIDVAKMLSYHPDICDVWDDIKDDFDASDVVRHEGCIEVLFTHVCFIGSIRIYHDLRIYTHDEDGEEISTGTWGISPAVTDYLRSLSINIGYSTHSAQDLIDAGIVVEQTNQTK